MDNNPASKQANTHTVVELGFMCPLTRDFESPEIVWIFRSKSGNGSRRRPRAESLTEHYYVVFVNVNRHGGAIDLYLLGMKTNGF
jgi:hypothetical protein